VTPPARKQSKNAIRPARIRDARDEALSDTAFARFLNHHPIELPAAWLSEMDRKRLIFLFVFAGLLMVPETLALFGST